MILVSSCLAGCNCRHNGKNNEKEEVVKLVREGKAMAACPEVLGGLDIPRPNSEIIEKDNRRKIFNSKGEDLTEQFIDGAKKVLSIAKMADAKIAILKSKSPSCGSKQIFDGTFSETLINGSGITAELLQKNGIKVYTEHELDQINFDEL